MKEYLETVFDVFVYVATIISVVTAIVGLFSLLLNGGLIPLWVEVIAIVIIVLGGSYIIIQDDE